MMVNYHDRKYLLVRSNGAGIPCLGNPHHNIIRKRQNGYNWLRKHFVYQTLVNIIWITERQVNRTMQKYNFYTLQIVIKYRNNLIRIDNIGGYNVLICTPNSHNYNLKSLQFANSQHFANHHEHVNYHIHILPICNTFWFQHMNNAPVLNSRSEKNKIIFISQCDSHLVCWAYIPHNISVIVT